jgi:predicted nucleic acid-binding protein
MILIDTNIFLASLRQPVTEADIHQHDQATELLGRVSRNEERALISEIVLHECFHVLVMRDKEIDERRFCSLFRRMLYWPGWALGQREMSILLRALDILEYQPRLEFSDSVIAARAEAHGAQLATFDKRLAAVYEGPAWNAG